MAGCCSWRNQYAVLVAEAHTLGSVGVVRSLGRAGYQVHAASSTREALGFKSKFATKAVCHPPYDSGEQFLQWLRDYIRTNHVCVVVPSEGFLLTVRKTFDEFAHLIPFGPNADIIYQGLSKYDLFRLLSSSSETAHHLPATYLVHDTTEHVPLAELANLPLPVFIKADAVYSKNGCPSCTVRCETAKDVQRELEKLARQFRRLLVQGYVPGQGVGVFLLSWLGQIRAEFMHKRIHEVPHTGGVSSFRESWFDAAIRDDSLLKLQRLGWEGVAMFEYRWDAASGEFNLMEMNGRFWGSLHLALFAGVDFPTMLVDCHLGNCPDPVKEWKQVSCRYTFPRDLDYLWSRCRDRKLPLAAKLHSIGEFLSLSFDPRVKADLLFPGDTSLYWSELARSLRKHSGLFASKLAYKRKN